MKIKAWRIGDTVRFRVAAALGTAIAVPDGARTGRIIARYPDIGAVDVIDPKGHIWQAWAGHIK